MRLSIDAPDWLVNRAIRVARDCPPESDYVVAFTDLSFRESFELLELVLEATAEAALDSPEAARPLDLP